MSQFFSVVKRRSNEKAMHLARKLLRDLESGQFKAPTSSDVLYTLRTEKLNLNRRSQHMKMDLSARDREIRLFEQRYPSVRSQPIQLNSSNEALSMSYAHKVTGEHPEHPSIHSWWSMRRAKADKDMRGEIDALSISQSASSSQLRINQSMEEEALHAGLEAVVEKGAMPAQTFRGATTTTDNTLLRFGPQERRRKERKI